jgi:serine/threonine-protein kinase
MAHLASQAAPERVGGYPISGVIGSGSLGTVYKGQDATTGKSVAIKVVKWEVTSDPVLRMRFVQECKAASILDHPHAVKVLDFGLDGNKPFLVMEYVEGVSLAQRLEKEKRLPEQEAVRLTTQVGQALHHAHLRRLIHRDVKPGNVMIDGQGDARLIDLGLVKVLDSDLDLTQTRHGLGTPHFMSPEQFEDAKRADERSDLYSLAATLYALVTGQLPFRAGNSHALGTIYKKKVANQITPPRQVVPELSEGLERAVLRALRADRAERQASVLEFLEALRVAAAPRPAAPEPKPAPAPSVQPRPELRARKRVSSRRCTVCQPLQRSLEKSWSGRVVNLSEGGLCLKLGRRFEPGVLLTVAVEGGEVVRRSLVARVVWVKKDGPKQWKMGCRFEQPLCESEVNDLA